VRFPLVGSAALLSLYMALKLVGPRLANLILAAWFGFMGAGAIAVALSPLVPSSVTHPLQRLAGVTPACATEPLRLRIPAIPWFLPRGDSVSIDFTTLAALPLGAAVSAAHLVADPALGGAAPLPRYMLNNAMASAFCLAGLEEVSLSSAVTGLALLGGLFVYDVFWVFCTPVMVGVARGIDAPIKLLLPRGPGSDWLAPLPGRLAGPADFSLLGLGDIVLPGIWVALMARADQARVQRLEAAGTADVGWRSVYLTSSVAAYALGLVATVAAMSIFSTAQPALLYLAPAVTMAPALAALLRAPSPADGLAGWAGRVAEARRVLTFDEEAGAKTGKGGEGEKIATGTKED